MVQQIRILLWYTRILDIVALKGELRPVFCIYMIFRVFRVVLRYQSHQE